MGHNSECKVSLGYSCSFPSNMGVYVPLFYIWVLLEHITKLQFTRYESLNIQLKLGFTKFPIYGRSRQSVNLWNTP